MPAETVDLDAHLPALLFALGSKIALHAHRESARPLGLDMCEWRVIQILGRDGPSTINQVADRIAMDRGGTSRAIARLEARGIIARRADPRDRRRSTVLLTPEANDVHGKVAAFANWRESQLTATLSDDEKTTLTALLLKLNTGIDSMLAGKDV